jgi:hypothetical protein
VPKITNPASDLTTIAVAMAIIGPDYDRAIDADMMDAIREERWNNMPKEIQIAVMEEARSAIRTIDRIRSLSPDLEKFTSLQNLKDYAFAAAVAKAMLGAQAVAMAKALIGPLKTDEADGDLEARTLQVAEIKWNKLSISEKSEELRTATIAIRALDEFRARDLSLATIADEAPGNDGALKP